MNSITRREFGGAVLVLGSGARKLFGATGLDEALRTGAQKHKIPAVVAMVANSDKIIWSGAYGKRDSASSINVNNDSMFQIASMTKAITSTAALQLVEQGKVKLDEPVS